jgi:hypothetical protein
MALSNRVRCVWTFREGLYNNATGNVRIDFHTEFKFKFNLFTLFGVYITLEEIFMMYIRYKYIKKF